MYVILFLNIFIFKNISACQCNMESLYLSFFMFMIVLRAILLTLVVIICLNPHVTDTTI